MPRAAQPGPHPWSGARCTQPLATDPRLALTACARARRTTPRRRRPCRTQTSWQPAGFSRACRGEGVGAGAGGGLGVGGRWGAQHAVRGMQRAAQPGRRGQRGAARRDRWPAPAGRPARALLGAPAPLRGGNGRGRGPGPGAGGPLEGSSGRHRPGAAPAALDRFRGPRPLRQARMGPGRGPAARAGGHRGPPRAAAAPGRGVSVP
jgi:hypothetical protein